jgi:hypothetical protein
MLDKPMVTEPSSGDVPSVLTLQEVAPLLRMSVLTLRTNPDWIKRLGAVKIAGKWLVPRVRRTRANGDSATEVGPRAGGPGPQVCYSIT